MPSYEKSAFRAFSLPEHQVEQAPFSILGCFVSPPLEEEFRQAHREQDWVRARFALLAAVLAYLIFVVTDYDLFGISRQTVVLIAVRLSLLLSALLILFLLRQQKSSDFQDAALLFWNLILYSASLYINSTRPVDFVGHLFLDLLLVIYVYVLLPVRLSLQLASSLLWSATALLFTFFYQVQQSRIMVNATLAAFFLANLAGALTSLELSKWKRLQFLALRSATSHWRDLEKAIAEIKTLHGIIPICAHCKRVIDDSGNWVPVEAYVHTKTHADFSHGLGIYTEKPMA